MGEVPSCRVTGYKYLRGISERKAGLIYFVKGKNSIMLPDQKKKNKKIKKLTQNIHKKKIQQKPEKYYDIKKIVLP